MIEENMTKAVTLAKKVLGIHSQQGVRPLHNLIHVGSEVHGYCIPANFLDESSVCYCVGAGEDVSFDTELNVLYGSQVFIFDPTPEGINHFKNLREYTEAGQPLTITRGSSFTYRISREQLDKVTFVDIGVWDSKTTLKFYDPEREGYASHSVYLFTDSKTYIEAPVDRLSSLMQTLGHSHIDLLKLEIEGAEYTVIDTIVDDNVDVKVILVEFDEVHNASDKRFHFRIKNACNKLKKAGYVLVHSSESMKRTFVRKDVYERLNGNA